MRLDRLSHAGNRSRSGFTLIELMVAMALSLFLMTILAEAFAVSMDTFRGLRAIGDMQDTLRNATRQMREDLSLPHFEGARKMSDNDFWMEPRREGFFYLKGTALPIPVPPALPIPSSTSPPRGQRRQRFPVYARHRPCDALRRPSSRISADELLHVRSVGRSAVALHRGRLSSGSLLRQPDPAAESVQSESSVQHCQPVGRGRLLPPAHARHAGADDAGDDQRHGSDPALQSLPCPGPYLPYRDGIASNALGSPDQPPFPTAPSMATRHSC